VNTLESTSFNILLRTKYEPSLVKIHWRMLILECSQGCYAVKIWPGDLDLWPWKSIGFQILLRTKHSRINILQWILTKLGSYLVLKRIWNPNDFQGHMSKIKVTGSNFYSITSLWTLESTIESLYMKNTYWFPSIMSMLIILR
jgi:hypothetical protein